MAIATAKIEFRSHYCQSRFHNTDKKSEELADDYERRTWREKMHVTPDGEVFIPGMAFANCIKEAAKFLSIKIPGKNQQTWTKHFEAGIMVIQDVLTGYHKDQAIELQMFVPSNGKRGSGSRVMKSFPILPRTDPPLTVNVNFLVSDPIITPEVFAHHLQQAGMLIGVGSFRIRNYGQFGRFAVTQIDWEQSQEIKAALPPINIKEAA